MRTLFWCLFLSGLLYAAYKYPLSGETLVEHLEDVYASPIVQKKKDLCVRALEHAYQTLRNYVAKSPDKSPPSTPLPPQVREPELEKTTPDKPVSPKPHKQAHKKAANTTNTQEFLSDDDRRSLDALIDEKTSTHNVR